MALAAPASNCLQLSEKVRLFAFEPEEREVAADRERTRKRARDRRRMEEMARWGNQVVHAGSHDRS